MQRLSSNIQLLTRPTCPPVSLINQAYDGSASLKTLECRFLLQSLALVATLASKQADVAHIASKRGTAMQTLGGQGTSK